MVTYSSEDKEANVTAHDFSFAENKTVDDILTVNATGANVVFSLSLCRARAFECSEVDATNIANKSFMCGKCRADITSWLLKNVYFGTGM